jgi:hypothetical protein
MAPSPQIPAAEGWVGGETFERPMLMRSGDDFGCFTSNITGAPLSTPTLYLAFARILV